jgi:hypothetical protein
MASRRSPKGPRPVDAIKHRDKRVNIPTEELREFVRAEEESPKTLLYPRDPSLDPQLVWKGKDEQDREPLEVPVVPVYIQDKIHPQALIENLRDTAKEGEREPELALFDDFNGVKEFRQKIDFYSHDLGSQPKWANRMILGESLLVMTSLAEKEGLKGKVQMIYVDPPYGIKFGSNWQVSTRKRDVKDGKPQDGFVAEWQEEYGRLPVLLVRMNPDLAMGDELLKKTGAGNLFMVFGEPDMEIRTNDDGEVVVEIRGVDVYDPTTGVIRSSTTDDIACWFLDTNYDEESFFVRHAYFTGAGDPYEKLKRALRAEVDEAAWATLYSTVSRPFDPPETGKIVVKVINHYGDEVLKVFEVAGAGTSAAAARTSA